MIPQLPLGSLPSGYSEPLAAQTLSLPDHVTQHHRTILFAFVLFFVNLTQVRVVCEAEPQPRKVYIRLPIGKYVDSFLSCG